MFKRVVSLISCGFAAMAIAQVPASQPSAAASTVSAPPAHNCVRPERPGRLATSNQVKTYDKSVLTYRDCMQAFVKMQGELVKLHSEIGNNAVKEYNDYVTAGSKPNEEAAK